MKNNDTAGAQPQAVAASPSDLQQIKALALAYKHESFVKVSPAVVLDLIARIERADSSGIATPAAHIAPAEAQNVDELNEFLKWWRANDYDGIEVARAAWLARSGLATPAASAPTVPEGYVIVPKVPTDEMRDAGNVIMLDRGKLFHIWREMLAAAPAAPTASADAVREAREQALEEAIAVVPGGSICDPQQVVDAIRALKSVRTGEGADRGN